MPDHEWIWQTAQIPEQHRGRNLDGWQIHSQVTHNAAQAALHFVNTWPERFSRTTTRADRSLIGQGIALIGTPGTGKTTLACMIATEIRLAHTATILYYRASNLLTDIRKASGKRADERTLRRLDRLNRVHFLLIDDVGKEYRTDSGFVGSELNKLFRERFELGLPTGVSSNEPLERWGELYDKALTSFAHEAFLPVNLAGKDMRRA